MKQSNEKIQLGIKPKILDRYVAREYLVSYLIAIVVVLSLRLLLDLFTMFDEFVEKQADGTTPGVATVIGYITKFYGPKIFEYFRDFSGMIVLLAAAFSLTRLTRNNELIAVLASGISLKRVIFPIVLLGFLLNMVMVADQELVLPKLADRLALKHDEMSQLRTISLWLLPDRDESLLSARKYNPQDQTMQDVMVILRKDMQLKGHLTATSAKWDEANQQWQLTDGVYYPVEAADANAEASGELSSDVISYKSGLTPVAYKSDLTPEYLWLQRNSNYKSLMSSSELSNLLKRKMKRAEYNETISEKYFRFTDPIINMVMLLLGLPMLVTREKKSTKSAMFFAFIGAGGCFTATFACKLVGGVLIDPLLAAWLPIIVFLPLSVLALDAIKT